MENEIEVRCAGGQACGEVVDRLVAADKVEYVDGDRPCADRLRVTAARIAEVHGYGTDHLEDGAA